MKTLKQLFILLSMATVSSTFANGLNRNDFVPVGQGSPSFKTNDNYFYSNILKKCEGELPAISWKNIGKSGDSIWQNSVSSIDGIVSKKKNELPQSLQSYLSSLSDTEEAQTTNEPSLADRQKNELKRLMRANCMKQNPESVYTDGDGVERRRLNIPQTIPMDLSECEQIITGVDSTTFGTAFNEFNTAATAGASTVIDAGGTMSDLAQQYEGLSPKEKKLIGGAFSELLIHCELAKTVLAGTDFEDPDALSSESVDSSSGAMMACMNSPNPQQCMMQNSGSKVSCKNNGVETQDFVQCKKITTWLEGFTIAKQGLQMTQQVRVLDNQMDMQADIMQKQTQEGGVGIKDTLEVQKEGVEQQAGMANERATFDAAKAAILAGMISEMPTREKLLTSCEKSFTKAKESVLGYADQAINDEDAKAGYKEMLTGADADNPSQITARSACNKLVIKTSVVMNQKARSKFKLAAFQAGTDAVANIAKGAILNKQADKIGDAIDDIEDHTPPEFNPWANYEDAMASECIANPDAEGCIQAQEQYQDYYGGNFRINGDRGVNSQGTNLSDISGRDGDLDGASGSDGPRNLIPNSFGSINTPGSESNEFADAPVAAGSMKKVNGGAGGGGGGSAGAVSAPGGAPNTGGGKNAASSQLGKGVKVKFSGTGGGSLAFRGGRGLANAGKKRTDGNPLSNLFGKKGKNNKGKLMDFRGPASGIGSKKGSIFNMISNRYNSVAKDKRLKEYKLTK
mgnify:CR=1 FL=1|tara:strand:- start:12151 stop:14373 length:2223 start_codon:yes stop_codon:yes gene_type:complete